LEKGIQAMDLHQGSVSSGEDSSIVPPRRAPFRRISVSQHVHEALRERIVRLNLAPGQSLSRPEIAEFYGVSQTPVRDAMLKLQEEGLLAIYPQSKTLVSKIDVGHARATQFLRLSLELEIGSCLAQNCEMKRLVAARTALSRQKAALADQDLEHFAQLDRHFHFELYKAAGVADLWQLVTSRSGHIDRLRNLDLPEPGKPANIIHYHEQIVDAIEAGDRAATEAAIRAHLSGTLSKIDQIVANHPEFF